MSADVTNPRRKPWAPIASTSPGEAPASRKSRFTTSATSRPSIRVSQQFAERRKRDKKRPLLLLADGQPGFERRDRARAGFEAWHSNELSRATLIGLALTDRNYEEARPAEVEVLDVEAGDFGAPPSRCERQQHDRAIADGERRGRRPLELERRGKPFRGDGGWP
jgi:hypothetical protein